MNKKENIQAASEYVAKFPNDALKILRGEKEAPTGILRNSIYIAMENQALTDVELARKLASLSSTRMGQEISILTEANPNSPVKLMKDLIEIREKAFEKKYNGRKVKDVVKNEVERIKKEVKVPDKYDWNSFVDSIETC